MSPPPSDALPAKPAATGARKPRATQDARSQTSRARLLGAVQSLARRLEITDISISDICAEAEMTSGAVYFHFGSRDGVIEEAIIDLVNGRYRKFDSEETLDLRQVIARVIEAVTALHENGGRQARAIAAVINTRPRVYEAWLASRGRVIAALQTAIAAHRGALGLTVTPAAYLAHFILNSIEDLAMDVFQWRNPNLEAYVHPIEAWKTRQCALWTWAVSAPDV